MLCPKSKGSGIMVSDFIDERIGFLALTDEEYEEANKHDITMDHIMQKNILDIVLGVLPVLELYTEFYKKCTNISEAQLTNATDISIC